MKALLIIDVQNDYFEKGLCELDDSFEISMNIKRVLEEFRKKELPIIHIQHINIRKEASFFLPNTFGVNIHENVLPKNDELVVMKNYPNSFIETELENILESMNINELVICGMMSHMCVDSTTRAAFDKGYKCSVIYDACTTKDLSINSHTIKAKDVHNSTMASLNYLFAKVKMLENILNEI